MSTAAKPTTETPELSELRPFRTAWDFNNQRLTLIQRQHDLAIHPVAITITFESLELLFHQLYTVALQARGVLAQAQSTPVLVVPPSGGPSDPPRSSDPRRSLQ